MILTTLFTFKLICIHAYCVIRNPMIKKNPDPVSDSSKKQIVLFKTSDPDPEKCPDAAP